LGACRCISFLNEMAGNCDPGRDSTIASSFVTLNAIKDHGKQAKRSFQNERVVADKKKRSRATRPYQGDDG